MSYTSDEIGSQPATWRKAADRGRDLDPDRFLPGRRLAVVGCGTSFHMAQAFAALREARGLGEADAFVASEWLPTRRYDVEPVAKAAERLGLAMAEARSRDPDRPPHLARSVVLPAGPSST